MSTGAIYDEVAGMLCRDGRQWFVGPFTAIPRAQVVRMLRERWPSEDELKRYRDAGGSFHAANFAR